MEAITNETVTAWFPPVSVCLSFTDRQFLQQQELGKKFLQKVDEAKKIVLHIFLYSLLVAFVFLLLGSGCTYLIFANMQKAALVGIVLGLVGGIRYYVVARQKKYAELQSCMKDAFDYYDEGCKDLKCGPFFKKIELREKAEL